jgi:hypothetical protein
MHISSFVGYRSHTLERRVGDLNEGVLPEFKGREAKKRQ